MIEAGDWAEQDVLFDYYMRAVPCLLYTSDAADERTHV
jgi:hypothetical protein